MDFKKVFIPFRICFAYMKACKKTLITLVLVVFIGILSSLFFFTQEESGTAEAAAQLEQLVSDIRHYYQNRPDYWGLSTQVVIDKKICPHEMLKNNQLIGYFENPILIGNGPEANILMPGARSFDIIYKDLNKKQCVSLASFDFDQTFWLGITGITIKSDYKTQFFTWDDEKNGLPIKNIAAKDICKEKNMIIWHCGQ